MLVGVLAGTGVGVTVGTGGGARVALGVGVAVTSGNVSLQPLRATTTSGTPQRVASHVARGKIKAISIS